MATLALLTNRQHDKIFFTGLGHEAQYIEKKWFDEVNEHLIFPISMDSDLHKFHNLAETWKEETQLSSSISEIERNRSYLEIISMGEKVLVYIFQDLKHKPAHWFPALRAITRINPIKPLHRGNIRLMTEDWLKWGEENDYI